MYFAARLLDVSFLCCTACGWDDGTALPRSTPGALELIPLQVPLEIAVRETSDAGVHRDRAPGQRERGGVPRHRRARRDEAGGRGGYAGAAQDRHGVMRRRLPCEM